jgi:hypothetical protein
LALESELPFRKKTSELASGPASQLVCWVGLVALSLVAVELRQLKGQQPPLAYLEAELPGSRRL